LTASRSSAFVSGGMLDCRCWVLLLDGGFDSS
jgi:hypothetical protein